MNDDPYGDDWQSRDTDSPAGPTGSPERTARLLAFHQSGPVIGQNAPGEPKRRADAATARARDNSGKFRQPEKSTVRLKTGPDRRFG